MGRNNNTNSFLNEILQTTQASYTQVQISREKNKDKYIAQLNDDISNLSKRILFRWKIKVRNSAIKGRSNAYIYFLKNSKDQFLIRGTKADGLTFFKNEGVPVVLENIKKVIQPEGFEVETKLVPKFGFVVDLSWGHHFEKTNGRNSIITLRPKNTIF